MATREDCAYAAGIIDGEGCILIARRRDPSHHELHVRVQTVDEILCPWLHLKFGGSLCKINRCRSDWRNKHCWAVSSAAAENFLRMIVPWLKLKKPQAELAFAFRATFRESFRGRRLPKELREQRAQFFERMKTLKEECLLG